MGFRGHGWLVEQVGGLWPRPGYRGEVADISDLGLCHDSMGINSLFFGHKHDSITILSSTSALCTLCLLI